MKDSSPSPADDHSVDRSSSIALDPAHAAENSLLTPLMIPLEIVGHLARPLSLSLRLFGNMMGHEQIVTVLLILMPAAYPLLALSTALGVLVIFIQSFI